MAQTITSQWEVATYVGDNDGEQNIVLDAGGRKVNFGKLTKGQKVNVPVSLIDGVVFGSDEQLVYSFTPPKRTRRKKATDSGE